MRVRELFVGETVDIMGADVEVMSLAFDSRRVAPGSLFAALVGARQDGHEHVATAVDRGAVCVLCERPIPTGPATRVLAPNSRLALARAARRFYGDPTARLLAAGVTGTNGKTTVVHLLEAILSAAGRAPAMIGTLGSRFPGRQLDTGLTTPESIDLLAELQLLRSLGATALAMEVSSHALAQERVAGCAYDVGVFTNLTHDHLDYHGNLEQYFQAKTRLFTERLKPGGHAAINLDDTYGLRLAGQLPVERVWGFSFAPVDAPSCRVWLDRLELNRDGIAGVVHTPKGQVEFSSRLVGRFNVANVLAAITAASALDLDRAAITRGIFAMPGVPGRMERVGGPGSPLVLVDYAHTPDALANVLTTVRELKPSRLICVFGCGGDRDPRKRRSMGETAIRGADLTIVTSDNPRREDPLAIIAAIEEGMIAAGGRAANGPAAAGYRIEPDRAEAIRTAVQLAKPGDAILVAGKGHETYQIVAEERRQFDDRAHCRAALQAAGFSAGLAKSGTDSED